MERIDLTKTIKEATATFCQNRIGDKPPISVTVPTIMTDIPWPDRKLQELVKLFLYETLLTNDPEARGYRIAAAPITAERSQRVCRRATYILAPSTHFRPRCETLRIFHRRVL
jgi:hypothetical protein